MLRDCDLCTLRHRYLKPTRTHVLIQDHGCLAMAAYGDYNTLCPRQFTYESLQHQYPGNQNQPFEVVGTFGPTPNYGMTGFMVRVSEMNSVYRSPRQRLVS